MNAALSRQIAVFFVLCLWGPLLANATATEEVTAAEPPLRYSTDIKPLLLQRCVVCHGCYDAPCQLKLATPEGLLRGANRQKVYHSTRLMAAQPTRLFEDADSLNGWREMGFTSVLGNAAVVSAALPSNQTAALQASVTPPSDRTDESLGSKAIAELKALTGLQKLPSLSLASISSFGMDSGQSKQPPPAEGVMAKALMLKQHNALPVLNDGRLDPEHFNLSINRSWSCPRVDEFDSYAKKNPYAGMPYGLPALDADESALLMRWLEEGAVMDTAVGFSGNSPVPVAFQDSVDAWEKLLNQSDTKSRLVARYIYEHLFLAHLYFPEVSDSAFFQLVRSATPPGEPIRLIATRRPFDDPGQQPVYYRIRPVVTPQLAKTQMAYAFGEARRQRINALFFDIDYPVETLPGYRTDQAANPFITYRQLPVRSRYQFMLDRAEFTIRSFMKGAVCRGQLALNVINDRFWVFFVDPDGEKLFGLDSVLQQHPQHLDLPAKADSNAEPLSNWLELSNGQERYLKAKSEAMNKAFSERGQLGIELVWDGEGDNPNAALTVFRHSDSASVHKGLLGGEPKTVWLIDYPILERIHYLLVAGFDVYGNAGHQVLTRLYMDFLRMESEFNFLTLLPAASRDGIIKRWYRGASDDIQDYLQGDYAYMRHDSDIAYYTADPKVELLQYLQQHLAPVLDNPYSLDARQIAAAEYEALTALDMLVGKAASLMPEMSLLLLEPPPGESSPRLYTLLRNSAHSNISGPLNEASRRRPEEDSLTVLQGVTGAYPDAFWRMNREGLKAFSVAVGQLENEADYRKLVTQYGIRRSDPDFWQFSDRVHRLYRELDSVNSGLLDYNRLENR